MNRFRDYRYLAEGGAALIADVRLLARVHALVTRALTAGGERLLAVRTSERLLAAMHAL